MPNEDLIKAWRGVVDVARSMPGTPPSLIQELSDRIDDLQGATCFLEQVEAFHRALDARQRLTEALSRSV